MTVEVGVVVVTHDRIDDLRTCLHALGRQTRPPDLVLVVDNASADGSSRMVLNEFPGVAVDTLPRNLGGAGGFAHGLERLMQAGVDYGWLMDDDAIPSPQALERLVASMVHPRAGAPAFVASLVVGEAGVRDQRTRNPPVLKGIRPSDCPPGTYAASYATFVGVLVDLAIARTTWLPMTDFRWLWDDTEYTARLERLSGRGLVCVGHPATLDPISGARMRCAVRNTCWMLKHRRLGSVSARRRAWHVLRMLATKDLRRSDAKLRDVACYAFGFLEALVRVPRRSWPRLDVAPDRRPVRGPAVDPGR